MLVERIEQPVQFLLGHYFSADSFKPIQNKEICISQALYIHVSIINIMDPSDNQLMHELIGCKVQDTGFRMRRAEVFFRIRQRRLYYICSPIIHQGTKGTTLGKKKSAIFPAKPGSGSLLIFLSFPICNQVSFLSVFAFIVIERVGIKTDLERGRLKKFTCRSS